MQCGNCPRLSVCRLLNHGTPITSTLRKTSIKLDLLYGVRTEAMCLNYKVREVETIQYVDVTSLYPYICKYKLPVDHPVIHVGDICKDKEACLRKKGLMKCSIVPPDRFYHAVLPFRANQKLMFSLCRTCVLTSNTEQCCHKTD